MAISTPNSVNATTIDSSVNIVRSVRRQAAPEEREELHAEVPRPHAPLPMPKTLPGSTAASRRGRARGRPRSAPAAGTTADLADAVVMRERSAVVEHHLPRACARSPRRRRGIGKTARREAHREVDAHAGVVGLGHAVGEIRRADSRRGRRTGGQRALDGGAHALDPVPGHRGLERFADQAAFPLMKSRRYPIAKVSV